MDHKVEGTNPQLIHGICSNRLRFQSVEVQTVLSIVKISILDPSLLAKVEASQLRCLLTQLKTSDLVGLLGKV
jgi:hypothetical protein